MELVTVTGAARKLECAPSTIRSLADRGHVRHVIVEPRGDRVFAVADPDEFLKAHRRQERPRVP